MNQRDRKYMILNAIIKDYIARAEPVGSRTLEKRHKFGVSSATIRNEMADLEDMGFLTQPHTSSGRIPSNKAYRLYVDRFMEASKLDTDSRKQVRGIYGEYMEELNRAVEHTLNVLTKMTNYTSLIVSPTISTLYLRDVKLVYIDERRAILIIVTKEGIIKNREVRFDNNIVLADLEVINNALSVMIKDAAGDEIADKLDESIKELTLEQNQILMDVIPALKSLMDAEEDAKIYSAGVGKMLDFPEFSSVSRARQFIDAINQKETLEQAIRKNRIENDSEHNIKITIGTENEIEDFSDCSIITANYTLNGKPIGTIGVIGPTRMNYDYAVSTLDYISEELTKHIDNLFENKEDKNGE